MSFRSKGPLSELAFSLLCWSDGDKSAAGFMIGRQIQRSE